MSSKSLALPFRAAPLALALAAGLATFAACLRPAMAAPAAKPAATARPAQVAMPVVPCGSLQVGPLVQLPVGKSTVVRPPSPVARILLGNPENSRAGRPAPQAEEENGRRQGPTQRATDPRPGVADVDVLLLGPTEIYMLGKTVGSTNVVVVDRGGACTAYDVVVGLDTSGLQAAYAQLLPKETGIKVSAAADSLVLSGTVSDTEALVRATDLANAYARDQDASASGAQQGSAASRNPRIVNLLDVAEPQQVVLEVKVAEVSKALLDQFGIDFARATVNADGTVIRFLSGIFGGGTGLYGQIGGTTGAQVGGGIVGSTTGGNSSGAITGQAGDVTVGGGTTQFPIAAGRNATMAALNMQKTDGLVKVLAEPTVMALSGQSGSFLAGGKVFIPVVTDNAGSRTLTLEEKEFGVSVKFTPTVLGSGRINLKVRPEVSELNSQGIQVSAGGVAAVLPSFTSRKAETTVQLMDGQSFVIGGLVKNNTTSNIKAFPFLGELPILGALFRSTEFQTDRTELVFVITPRLAKPLPADYKLPTDGYVPPSRTDLIFGGKLEGRAPEPAPAPAGPTSAAPAAPAPQAAAVPTPAPAPATLVSQEKP